CEAIFRELCTGVAGELNLAHVFSLRLLVYLGRLRDLSERLPKLQKEAEERGDRFLSTSLGTRFSYIVNLMADNPQRARRQLHEAVDSWSREGFHLQHYFHLVGDTEISLYSRLARTAWQELLDRWRSLQHSRLLQTFQVFRIESHYLRGRCAVAAACAP